MNRCWALARVAVFLSKREEVGTQIVRFGLAMVCSSSRQARGSPNTG